MNIQDNLKWYQKPNGAIGMLILFYPVGLYLMWKNEMWTKNTRILVSIFCFFALIFGIRDNSKSGNTFVSQKSGVTSMISLVTQNRASFGIAYGGDVNTITGDYQEKDGNIIFFWDTNIATGIAPKIGKLYDNKIIISNLYGGEDDVYIKEEN